MLDTLRQQLSQIEGQIQTAGGAVVAGDVKTGGGAFVGRDQILAALGNGSVILGGDANGLTIITGDGHRLTLPPDEVPLKTLLQAYYRSLANECCRLPLGVVDPQFVRPISQGDVSLSDVYVDLDVVSPPPIEEKEKGNWGLRVARGEGWERTPLLEAVAHPKSNRVVLLGDAGSGKTTFVNYLAYLLSTNPEAVPETLRGRLPVRLVLREIAARHIPADADQGRAGMIWDALKDDIAARLGEAAASRLYAYLHGRLLREGGLILLDGLDEVPQARRRRKALLEAIRDLVGTLPAAESRFIVTARPYAYADSAWQLPGFHILALAPFSQDQVERFIQRWYQGMRPAMGWNEETARDKGGRLRSMLSY